METSDLAVLLRKGYRIKGNLWGGVSYNKIIFHCKTMVTWAVMRTVTKVGLV